MSKIEAQKPQKQSIPFPDNHWTRGIQQFESNDPASTPWKTLFFENLLSFFENFLKFAERPLQSVRNGMIPYVSSYMGTSSVRQAGRLAASSIIEIKLKDVQWIVILNLSYKYLLRSWIQF